MVTEGICGAGFLTVLLDDTQRTMDTYRSNNVASLRVHYKCPQGQCQIVAAGSVICIPGWAYTGSKSLLYVTFLHKWSFK